MHGVSLLFAMLAVENGVTSDAALFINVLVDSRNVTLLLLDNDAVL